MRLTTRIAILLSFEITQVSAWTQNNRNSFRCKARLGVNNNEKTTTTTTTTTLLQAQKDDSRDENIEMLRNDLETMFSNDRQLFQFDREDNQATTTSVTSSISNFGDWVDASPCRGEECEQCEIPDEFKLPDTLSPVDVMAILGIQRAEPIRLNRK
uniref:Uncharacterized protein n=1 Tax=Eucampia antarctica TaxID=49252 RepID=A0A7S2R1D0_9STRA|mmetsp:Transcript_11122/g.10647  ORF Transcript_11122/g.10647 Transcript_11122/m.10647 type:complete len:156 (+) Transcript_11122:52-519(+)